jgi:hypothetical protein
VTIEPAERPTCRPCGRGAHDRCTLGEGCGCVECNPPEEPPPPVVEWAEPPRDRRRTAAILGSFSAAQVAEFRAHPGRWGIVGRYQAPTSATSRATKLRQGRDPSLPDVDGWTFHACKEGGGSVLYAKYGEAPE